MFGETKPEATTASLQRPYYHLPANRFPLLARHLWDIVTGRTPLPPDWAKVVSPLYKRGDWAVHDN